MLRRFAALGACLVVVACAVFCAGACAARQSPQLAVIAKLTSTSPEEVFLLGPDGQGMRSIESSGAIGDSTQPIWSPDGRELAFYAPGYGIFYPWISLMDADGSNVRRLQKPTAPEGTLEYFTSPTFDPISGDLVTPLMQHPTPRPTGGGGEISVPYVAFWSLPTDGSEPHLLGRTKPSLWIVPYSFAPNGIAAVTVASSRGVGIGTMHLGSGALHMVVPPRKHGGTYDPAVSPTGTEIAYLHYKYANSLGPEPSVAEPPVVRSDLMLVPFSGGKPKRLARISGRADWPSWDPSGSRIAFTREHGLFEINADGTCLTKVLSAPEGRVYGAAWRPGPGRSAGPINCPARLAPAH
jgi:hypothetical protein